MRSVNFAGWQRPRTEPARSLQALVAVLLLICLAGGPTWASPAAPDPALREALREALDELDGFPDEFEAQVWLTDMSSRLARQVPDREERLEILKHVHREATRAGLPPQMVLAVIDVESAFQRFAVSVANAQGLMQVMRFWLDELDMEGHELFDIQKNLRMGCTILRHYYDKERGDWFRALGRYNGSLGSARYPSLVFDRLENRWFYD